MKSAASAPGPALWGLQPLLFGQRTDLEAGVWPAPNMGNQHS